MTVTTNVQRARSISERVRIHTPNSIGPGSTSRVPIVGKAAIYTRVSTDRQQEGASLSVQLEACRTYCESHGYVVVDEFRDVLSGLNTERPEYQKAVDLARSNGIDKLVVWRLDRLGRDEAEYMTQLRDLRRKGVEVVSVTQPGESILMQNMLVVLAGEESRQLSVRISASKHRRFTEGKWYGGAPFGYSTEAHEDGGRVLAPNDDSRLVREMFKRYAKGGTTLHDLRRFLNEHGHWRSSQAVLYTLRNPAYVGVVRYGKYSRSRFGPSSEVAEVKGQHKPLIDQATFDKVQVRLSANRSRRNGGQRPRFLFTALVFCGECGHRYVAARTGRYLEGRPGAFVRYYCGRRVDFGDCESGSVKDSDIRAAVLGPIENLMKRLSKPEMRRIVRDEVVLRLTQANAASDNAATELRYRLQKLEAKLSRLEDSYLDETISRDRYLGRRDGILAELTDVQNKVAALPQTVAPELDGLFAAIDALSGEAPDDDEWREIVAEMVDRVVIGKTVEVRWKPGWESLRQ